MKRSICSRENTSSHHCSKLYKRAWRKKLVRSTIFGPPLDTGQLWRAISSPSFSRSLPPKGRTRERGARSLEWAAARGSCSRDSCLLRLENLGHEHGLEKADPR